MMGRLGERFSICVIIYIFPVLSCWAQFVLVARRQWEEEGNDEKDTIESRSNRPVFTVPVGASDTVIL